MNQNDVRIKLRHYIEETGTTQSFICRKLRIPTAVMSLFIHGKKDLYNHHLQSLDDYIDNRKR